MRSLARGRQDDVADGGLFYKDLLDICLPRPAFWLDATVGRKDVSEGREFG